MRSKQSRTFLCFNGTLFGTLEFEPGIMWETDGVPTQQTPRYPRETEPRIELLDNAGEVLTRAAVETAFPRGCGGAEGVGVGSVFAYVPLHPAVARLVFRIDERVVFGAQIDSIPPNRLTFEQLTTDGLLSVRWEPPRSSADSRLQYRLSCRDDAERVVNLANWTTQTSITVPMTKLPRGVSIRLELLASTGTRSSLAVGEPFQLPRVAPTLRIIEPVDGAVHIAGHPITLRGRVTDNLGRLLAWDNLKWTLSGTPVQTRHRTVTCPSPGEGRHIITLTYTDDEFQVTAAVEIHVSALQAVVAQLPTL